jgi:hypothetical protein
MARTGRPRVPMVVRANEDGKLPEKEINFDQVIYWINLGATEDEIAGSFFVSCATLLRRIQEKYGMTFAELKVRCSGSAKLQLRQNQLKLSATNASIAIWLGKVWLGQRDFQMDEAQSFRDDLVKMFVGQRREAIDQAKQAATEFKNGMNEIDSDAGNTRD